MPLPLVPIAGVAIRYGAVALVAYGVKRPLRPGRTDQCAEDALDRMDEGLAFHRPANRDQTNGAARLKRVFHIGGTAFEIDAAALGRFRLRRI